MYIYICIYTRVYVILCAYRLYRRKTSIGHLFFLFAGGSSTIASLLPTKTLAIVIPDLISLAYLH